MSEFENIQRLIRLKKFEQPGEGFTEEFLLQFHQRQRAELLKKSSISLLWERTITWWDNVTAPKWSLATAAVAVCALSLWMFTQSGEKSDSTITSVPTVILKVDEKPFVAKLDLSDLPMANMAARNDTNLENTILRKDLEASPTLEGKISPLPATGSEGATLKNAIPATVEGDETRLGK